VRALARLVADGDVDLRAVTVMPRADARQALLALPGVGEKVADCVLLFGLGFHDAFPVDVWVQRAVERWYFSGRPRTPRAIRAWANDRFGPVAGYAQQHLFAGARAAIASTKMA
jgi:N-glycosylase/DNA lyase